MSQNLFQGAHAPSRVGCGALAETSPISRIGTRAAKGEITVRRSRKSSHWGRGNASTRGACTLQTARSRLDDCEQRECIQKYDQPPCSADNTCRRAFSGDEISATPTMAKKLQ